MCPDPRPAYMRTRGFTLLEAIVALAILASAGLALFAAMSQSVQMVQRAEAARELDTAMLNALDWSAQVNPMHAPSGTRDLGAYELRWDAVAMEPPRDGATGTRQPGLHEVGLYRMRLELWQGGRLARSAVIHRAGFRQVRVPEVL